ncbi:MAG: substrate-binding domain-containing protein [Cyanophyceae cyanobacterium]
MLQKVEGLPGPDLRLSLQKSHPVEGEFYATKSSRCSDLWCPRWSTTGIQFGYASSAKWGDRAGCYQNPSQCSAYTPKGLGGGEATSRPLNATEIQAGIQGIPVARDALAVVVGADNPYQGGLSLKQLADIFRGRITNWNEVGGPDRPIRVLNRSPNSGTHSLFRDIVLLGQPFAPDGPSFFTFEQDVTTPILRALETDGISYTAVAQADNQLTVRIVPIDDTQPTDAAAVREGRYPLSRFVFFAAPTPTSPVVQDFLDFVLSPQGQSVVGRSDFLPL